MQRPELIVEQRHLRHFLTGSTDHSNSHRPHRTVEQTRPEVRAEPDVGGDIRVLRRDRLGGLIHGYAQVA
jgi:hypothetical protein